MLEKIQSPDNGLGVRKISLSKSSLILSLGSYDDRIKLFNLECLKRVIDIEYKGIFTSEVMILEE